MTGLLLSLLIALISMGISSLHPGFDSLVISIILGMLVGNFIEKKFFLQSGINICIRFCLPAGIILYGSQLIINRAVLSHLIMVPLIFFIIFFLALAVSRLIKIKRELSLLLATGLSVCGASAITVLSPLIGAKREETSLSIISVMVVGLIGLVIYPLLWSNSGLTEQGFALFTGTTLPMLGQVKVVSGMVSEKVLALSLNYKLLRIFLLMFLIIWFGFLKGEIKAEGDTLIFSRAVRLILVAGFILFVIMTNLIRPSVNLQQLLEPFSRFFLTLTLSAIGLSVELDAIAEIGPRPLYAVIICWLIACTVVYLIGHYYV